MEMETLRKLRKLAERAEDALEMVVLAADALLPIRAMLDKIADAET